MRKITTFLLFFLFSVVQVWAQTRTITGKVTDDKGAGIAGATVRATGGKGGTTTKADGSFSLVVNENAKTLTISGLDLETQTVKIPATGPVSVKMEAAKKGELEIVEVNTGYGKVNKNKYTGAATTLKPKDFANTPVGSIDQLFQGRVPGLLSLTGSGAPGTSANVIIRGTGSISGSNDPLYIVDGVPVESNVFQGINPADFASIDILRDAAGTALYGNRGSAGVIVVTTKRGVAGKPQFSYSGQFGYKDRPAFTYDMMTSKELLKAQEAYGNILQIDNTTNTMNNLPGWYYSALNPANIGITPAEIAANKAILDSMGGINTNWRDLFLRKGSFSNQTMSIRGGTGKTTYFSQIGLYNEEGITLRTDMKRISWRTNIDYSDDKFSFTFNSAFAYTKRNFQQSSSSNSLGNPFLISNLNVPYALAYKPDGTLYTGNRAISQKFNAANTLDLTMLDRNYNDQIKATFNINAGYKIFKNTSINFLAGLDYRETQGSTYGSRAAFIRTISASPTGRAGFQSESLTRYLAPNVRTTVNWKATYNDKHAFDVTGLAEYNSTVEKAINFTGYGIDPKTPNTPAAITPGNTANLLIPVVGGSKTQNTLLSGLLMARYTYNDKYTLSASYRSDGASNLPVATRWQKFFSVGGVWEASKEKFISSIKAINSLRVKMSYGNSGNFNNFPFTNFYYIPSYSTTGQYNGSSAYNPGSPGNPDLKWEVIYTANLGVDFELFKGRLYGDVNLYDRRTKDLFVEKSLSSSTASIYGASIITNAGILQNKGVEVSLNYQLIKNRSTTLTLFGNFAYNKNTLLDLGGAPSYEAGTELYTIGKPLGSHFEVKWGGVDAATGRPLYYDLNGKLTTDYQASNKVQEFGTWEAPWKGGFGARMKYKNFDFNILFAFQEGSFKSNNLEYFVENPVGFMANGYNQANTLNFWQKPGDIASTPSVKYPVNFSSKLIHNASFIRLKEISASYNLPQSSIDKLKFVKNLRFFILANNLYLWTKWIGMDPEAGATNINLSEFPNPKSVTLGLDISF